MNHKEWDFWCLKLGVQSRRAAEAAQRQSRRPSEVDRNDPRDELDARLTTATVRGSQTKAKQAECRRLGNRLAREGVRQVAPDDGASAEEILHADAVAPPCRQIGCRRVSEWREASA